MMQTSKLQPNKGPNTPCRNGRGGRTRRVGGVIMVQTLVILAGLMALLAVLASESRNSLNEAENQLRERRAEVAAKAGIARALVAVSTANTNIVTLNDDWAALGGSSASGSGTNGPGSTEFDLGNGTTFRVQVIDANSLIDINTATQAQLATLPLTQEQVDCLLDWRTTGTTPRTDGAKDEYYTTLTTPYTTRLGNLTTLDELLLVKNWTAYTLYYPASITGASATATTGTNSGTSAQAVQLQDPNGTELPMIDVLTVDCGMPNKTATGGNRTNLDANNLSAATLARLGITINNQNGSGGGNNQRYGPYTTLQQVLTQFGTNSTIATNILNNATTSSAARVEGKINLNTASLSVLETVPNVTQDVAQAIVAQQQQGFTTLGQLATISGVTTRNVAQIADSFGIGSDTWLVRVYGQSGGRGVAYEATIGIRNSVTEVVSWHRMPGATIPFWWNWSAAPAQTVQADTLQQGTSSSTSGSTTGGAQ